jgi:hypothetical protein
MGKVHRTVATRPPKKAEKKPQPEYFPYAGYGFLLLIILFIAFIRIRLLSFPLERDEGEYAYFGQLILQGIPPYSMAYNLKLPGTYYSYALIMAIFGQTIQGIRLGLLLFNIGSIIFVFLIVKKLFSQYAAILASATAGLLFLSPAVLGQAAHATHFVSFYMLAGVYLLLLAFERNKFYFYLLSGIMMGLSFLMKQSGMFFPIFGGIMILVHLIMNRPRNYLKSFADLLIYSAGVIFPVILIFLIMYASGVWDKFFFWTLQYPRSYGSRVPISQAWFYLSYTFSSLITGFKAFWITSALGLIALFFYPQKKWSRIFIAIFFLFSFLPAVPGFYFRQHYFIPFLPVLGMLTGIAFDFITLKVTPYFRQINYLLAAVFIIIVIAGINDQKAYFFDENPNQLCSAIYGTNPFNESIPIAKYIQANTGENDKILVLGSEPQIYFYSKRKSATSYIYMYDLVFDQKYAGEMRKEMFREVEKARPKFIVFVNCPYSWLATKAGSDSVFTWFNGYLQKTRYSLTGVADILSPEPTVYAFDNDALAYKTRSQVYIHILKRMD